MSGEQGVSILSGTSSLTVAIADDHPIVLTGLEALIGQKRGFDIVSVRSNGKATLEDVRRLEPNLAVLDINMPGLTGMSILEAIESEGLRTRTIFLTASVTDSQIVRAIELGVWGIILKDTASVDLINCLESIVSGNRWFPEELVALATQRGSERCITSERMDLLTSRELEVASLVAGGLSNKQIARLISCTEGTVKVHLHNIYQKLNIQNRTSLATLIVSRGDRAASKPYTDTIS